MQRRTLLAATAVPLLAACASPGGGPLQSDYAREARWRAEYEPGVLLGDVIELPGARGAPRFAAIWAAQRPVGAAVVLVHGIGTHPDHGLTSALRQSLFEAGMSTLAIQAPILDMTNITDAAPYAALMPEATIRVEAAVAFARAQGAQRVFAVGHTTGSWMLNEYLARSAQSIDGWAALGHTGRFGGLGLRRIATLDVVAERGIAGHLNASYQRAMLMAQWDVRSQQIRIPGADLSFADQHPQVAQALLGFFRSLS
jgi:hypothetical protein